MLNPTETTQQICNDCGSEYDPSGLQQSVTNPLCGGCMDRLDEERVAAIYSITTALEDRRLSDGLMNQIGDERFERFILKHVRAFNQAHGRLP